MKIIMLKGLPASGKSTWAKEMTEKGNYLRISKDDIRDNMLGGFSKKKERDVIKIRNQLIRTGIQLGRNVIVDDTNLNPIHERTIKSIAKELGATFEVNDSFLEVSPEECIERDLGRAHSVGQNVIYSMYEQYIAPSPIQRLEDEWEKPRCVIFDIDGTLAHNLSGRNIYDYTRVLEDTPDPLVSLVADSICENATHYVDIVILSGRDDDCREQTIEWLDRNMIPFTHLYMRKTGDRRADDIVKEELYHKYVEPTYSVLGIFDDRPKVCRMWRRLGLRVAQVGNPHKEF